MNKTGIVILAAGASSRFGKAKQLIQYKGKTLLQHVIDEAVKSGANSILVVTGADANAITSTITDKRVNVVFNTDWEKGMASGIVIGVKNSRTLDKIIITVCDQPFVDAALFQQLDKAQLETGKHIVACAYANTIGTPVLFTKKYFDTLNKLTGDTGAKQVIKNNMAEVTTVDFPRGAIDIDTQKDYTELLKGQ
jgi:molybdenum cofactor cytidylyltransferase